MKRKSSQKEKSRRAPAQAKTPTQRLNGNELAALKQISVLIASVLVFLNACSDEANLTFPGCLLRFAGKGAFLFGLACGIAFLLGNALRCSFFSFSFFICRD